MDNKLKILMFSDIFGANLTFIHNDILYLKDDYNIKYIAIQHIRNEALLKEFDNFKIIPFIENAILKKLKWWLFKYDKKLIYKNRSFSKQLKSEVCAFNPDIIHLNFGPEALRFLDNAYSSEVTYIIHFHGYGASAMFRKKCYKTKLKEYLLLPNIHQIYVSSFMEQRFISNGMKTERTRLIRYGVDLEKFDINKFVKTKNKELIFSQVSSQNEKKGITYTIKGYKRFREKNPTILSKLYITGDILEKNNNLVKKFKLEESVFFTGLLNHDQVRELLSKTDIFIHPSITAASGGEEGIPNAIIEAVALKIPVISTYHSGIPELITHNKNGYLVEERNADQICEAIQEVIKWKRLDYDSVDYLKSKKFDIHSHIEELKEFYKKILQ
jgi:colanic acid/amylovoran biosynthesis glycosyltransferase